MGWNNRSLRGPRKSRAISSIGRAITRPLLASRARKQRNRNFGGTGKADGRKRGGGQGGGGRHRKRLFESAEERRGYKRGSEINQNINWKSQEDNRGWVGRGAFSIDDRTIASFSGQRPRTGPFSFLSRCFFFFFLPPLLYGRVLHRKFASSFGFKLRRVFVSYCFGWVMFFKQRNVGGCGDEILLSRMTNENNT